MRFGVSEAMHGFCNLYTHMHAYIHTHINTRAHTFMHACMQACIQIARHTYVRTYIHVYIHKFISYIYFLPANFRGLLQKNSQTYTEPEEIASEPPTLSPALPPKRQPHAPESYKPQYPTSFRLIAQFSCSFGSPSFTRTLSTKP